MALVRLRLASRTTSLSMRGSARAISSTSRISEYKKFGDLSVHPSLVSFVEQDLLPGVIPFAPTYSCSTVPHDASRPFTECRSSIARLFHATALPALGVTYSLLSSIGPYPPTLAWHPRPGLRPVHALALNSMH